MLARTTGRLLEAGGRGRAAIGLTDRRLLCLSTTGEFVDVRHEYVCSIRSRERTRVGYRPGNDPDRTARLGAGLAALVAVVAGVVVTTAIGALQGALTVALAAATVGAVAFVQFLRTRSGADRAAEQLAVGASVAALLAVVGVALLASVVSVPLYALVTLGGLALAGYAARHRAALDGAGLEGRRESLLTVNTIDGESVSVAIDADSAFDRELSACVHRTDSAALEVPVAESPAERPRNRDGSATVRSR